MAPKGGKGGGGGGSRGSSLGSSCPGAFSTDSLGHSSIPAFASYIVFFLVTIGILIATPAVKKKHPAARRLLGAVYIFSLLSTLLAYVLAFIATLLLECGTTEPSSYLQWNIAFDIFFILGGFLLLVVAVYGVNSMLRRLHGHNPSYYNIIYAAILGVMFALTAAYMGVGSWNLWAVWDSDYNGNDHNILALEQLKLSVAYYVLYFIAVLAAGAIAIASLVSIRSQGTQGNISSLIGWVVAFYFCLVVWAILALSGAALRLESVTSISLYYKDLFDTYTGLMWTGDAFQAFSWIALLVLAKDTVLARIGTAQDAQNPPGYAAAQQEKTAYGQAQVLQHQQPIGYTFHAGPPPPLQPQQVHQQAPQQVPQQVPQHVPQQQPPQQYFYPQQQPQQPVYYGAAVPVNANGQVPQVR